METRTRRPGSVAGAVLGTIGLVALSLMVTVIATTMTSGLPDNLRNNSGGRTDFGLLLWQVPVVAIIAVALWAVWRSTRWATRHGWTWSTLAVIGAAALVGFIGFGWPYGFLTTYGDAGASRAAQAAAGLAHGGPAVLVATALVAGSRLPAARALAAAFLLGGVAAAGAAGVLAVNTKIDESTVAVPSCSDRAGDAIDGAKGVQVVAPEIADAFAELKHPARFTNPQPMSGGCAAFLVEEDLTDYPIEDAEEFYRATLPDQGWSVIESSPFRAVREGLAFTITPQGIQTEIAIVPNPN